MDIEREREWTKISERWRKRGERWRRRWEIWRKRERKMAKDGND